MIFHFRNCYTDFRLEQGRSFFGIMTRREAVAIQFSFQFIQKTFPRNENINFRLIFTMPRKGKRSVLFYLCSVDKNNLNLCSLGFVLTMVTNWNKTSNESGKLLCQCRNVVPLVCIQNPLSKSDATEVTNSVHYPELLPHE